MRGVTPLRVLPVALALVVVLQVTRIYHQRTTSDLSSPDAANIVKLQQTLAGLQSLGCSVLGSHLPLGERSAWPHGAVSAGRPESCLSCLCTVRSDDVDPEPECTITSCPSHMCDKKNSYAFEPDHPCCVVCNSTDPEPTPEPPRSVDAAIPLTRDVFDASLLHEPVSICSPSSSGGDPGPPMALLGVTSRPRSGARRALFRRLYGAELAAARLKFMFVLGRETRVERAVNQLEADEEEYEDYMPEELKPEEMEKEDRQHAAWQKEVDEEAARHGDILQTHTAEHYNHLSLKSLTLLDFASRHCRGVAFVIKTDDDVLVTVRRLASEVAALAVEAHTRSIYGHVCTKCTPSRGLMSWRSSHREWPWDTYPVFATGPGYLVSTGAVELLLKHAMDTPYHHLEDVFVTGIVAQAAGVERRQWGAQCINRVHGGDLCAMSHCALSHPNEYEDGGERMEMFAYAARRFDVDGLCASNVTMIDA